MRMDDAMYAWRDVVCVLHVDLRSAISDLSRTVVLRGGTGFQIILHSESVISRVNAHCKRDGRLGLLLTVRRGWRPTQTHSRHYKCVERT